MHTPIYRRTDSWHFHLIPSISFFV